MATNDDDNVFRHDDEASIALLRGLRVNTANRIFIHRVDVCSAAPEELLADLQPVPGTDVTEDGYKSVWFIYCPKRYKNEQGNPSGHRHRSVEANDDKTCWHSETGPKPVKGVPGATIYNLCYARKPGTSGRRVDRLGWRMDEFDDTQGGGGDYVLCRVHRSSSSSSSKRKRKAVGDHPEAPPTKLIHDEKQMQQVQVHQSPATFFTNNPYPTMPCYGYGPGPPQQGVDPVAAPMVEEHVVQQPYGGEVYLDEMLNIDEQVQMQKMLVQQDSAAFFTSAYPTTMPACYDGHGAPLLPQGLDSAITFVDVEPEHGGDLCVFTFQDLLKIDGDALQDFEDFLVEQGQGL